MIMDWAAAEVAGDARVKAARVTGAMRGQRRRGLLPVIVLVGSGPGHAPGGDLGTWPGALRGPAWSLRGPAWSLRGPARSPRCRAWGPAPTRWRSWNLARVSARS